MIIGDRKGHLSKYKFSIAVHTYQKEFGDIPSTRRRSFILLSFSIVSFAAIVPGSGTNGSIAKPAIATMMNMRLMIWVGPFSQRVPKTSG